MLNIVADENMPGLEAFAPFGNIRRLPGRRLSRQDLLDCDALLVRSVTQVNAALLQGTRVRFVGSATIGTDHVALDWLAQQGIAFAHAPGCNAQAVVEYVLQAILLWCQQRKRQPGGLSLGIVGLGNVGARLAAHAAALGIKVLACDPPREAAGEALGWPRGELEQLLACDVISLHVPLTKTSSHATRHLLGATQLECLRQGQLLINTCRGAVIDNQALLARLQQENVDCLLDVWEGEPQIMPELFSRVWRGTPHIAGYSLEGKLRGSYMLLEALASWRGESVTMPALPRAGQLSPQLQGWQDVLVWLRQAYRLEEDHRRLAESLQEAAPGLAFDRLRKDYPLRHELAAWQLREPLADDVREIVSLLCG